MEPSTNSKLIKWQQTAWYGFKNSLIYTYMYTLVFISYALFQTSFTIVDTLPMNEDLIITLFLNGFNILFSSMVLATAIAIVPSILGMVTALLISWLLNRLNPQNLYKVRLTGLVGSLFISSVFQLILHFAMNFSFITQPAETYFFWVGIPAIIHLFAGILWSSNLYNQKWVRPKKRFKQPDYIPL